LSQRRWHHLQPTKCLNPSVHIRANHACTRAVCPVGSTRTENHCVTELYTTSCTQYAFEGSFPERSMRSKNSGPSHHAADQISQNSGVACPAQEASLDFKEKSRKSTPTSLPCADLLGSGCPCRGSNLPSLRMNFYKCASTCRLKFLTFEFLQRELVTSDMLLEICTSAALVVVQTSNLQSPGVPDGGQPLSPRPFGQLLTTKKIGKRRR
jgi:hypothetical protein